MFKMYKLATFLLLYCFLLWRPAESQVTQNPNQRGVLASRNDNNYDIIVYLNGQPLSSNQQMNLQAFQQLTGIVLPTGQRVPPTAQIINGQLITSPTPPGMANILITVQRSYYGFPFTGNGK
ncbi:hypothetical protein TYRP_014667 [Tyrophagus putrescentiae]|nr:hypothetical protein TYRP_014667 [Tyrophagus putrescentiae]